MIGFICEALVNILLDFLLIKGRYGFPALGFNGAAVASVIADGNVEPAGATKAAKAAFVGAKTVYDPAEAKVVDKPVASKAFIKTLKLGFVLKVSI